MQSPDDRFYLSSSSDMVEKNMGDVGLSVVAVAHHQFYFGYSNGDLNFCEQQTVIRAMNPRTLYKGLL